MGGLHRTSSSGTAYLAHITRILLASIYSSYSALYILFAYRRLIGSYAVLQQPGLGYDCFRIWETLLAGSMPVMEKRTGLDRSLYRLPALLLDDFADVTPTVIRQAYVEALYRIDDWDFTRITEKHWVTILNEVSCMCGLLQ